MITRCSLARESAMKAWQAITHTVGVDGGQGPIDIIEAEMHNFGRALDLLAHQRKDDLMVKLRPHMLKGRKK